MRPLTLLLDMDEIVVDMQPFWYALHNERTGDTLSVENVTRWEIHELTPHGKAVFAPLSEPGFYENLPAMPGAFDGIENLRAKGHRVLLVSSAPNPESMKGKAIWVKQHMPGFKLSDLILTGAKEAVRGDVLFDDCPANLIAYRKAWPGSKLATIVRPYMTPEGLAACDCIAGSWQKPAESWQRFVRWVEGLQ